MGNRYVRILIVFSVLTVAGCGEKSKVIEETRRHLKDPDSAKFGDVEIVSLNEKDGRGNLMKGACVTVNSKNSYGGYVGDKEAMLIVRGEEIDFSGIHNITHDVCIQMMKENEKK